MFTHTKTMKKTSFFLFLLLVGFKVNAQYISEVIEYTPAPGQFINTSYGNPEAAQSITGTATGLVSLGAFGGYIVFKFQNPVENNPDNPYGIDFTVFGNPASVNSAEPASVFVMKDKNNNGLPDDTWYELAGSDYFFSSSIKNYEISYTNPNQSVAADVPWTDNQNSSGFVYANDFHTQPYYPNSENFPAVNQSEYTLSGTKIEAAIDLSDAANIKSYRRAFGYADNHTRGNINSPLPDNPYTEDIEGTGGDAFDISWAVDENGNYVDLNEADFIKVQCAVNANLAWLGELSTEITRALDVAPDASVNGTEDMVVIKDLPKKILTNTPYQLEAFAFHLGKIIPTENIIWTTNLAGTVINENNILNVSEVGTLVLTASFESNPDIFANFVTEVTEQADIEHLKQDKYKIYPNPAVSYFQIKNSKNLNVEMYNSYGKCVKKILDCSETDKINIETLSKGIYFLKIEDKNNSFIKKVIKN